MLRSWHRKRAISGLDSQNGHAVIAHAVMGQCAGKPHELCGIVGAELDEDQGAELDAAQLAELDAT